MGRLRANAVIGEVLRKQNLPLLLFIINYSLFISIILFPSPKNNPIAGKLMGNSQAAGLRSYSCLEKAVVSLCFNEEGRMKSHFRIILTYSGGEEAEFRQRF